MKRSQRILAGFIAAAVVLAACGSDDDPGAADDTASPATQAPSSEQTVPDEASTTEPDEASTAESDGESENGGARVALIGDQRFGDDGPMDDMARGLQQCADDFGYETKTFESIESAAHEDDIRAIARDGYDLIFTTFPAMSPATSTVAGEFEDTSFGAVYQFINIDGASMSNVWDTEYRGDSTYYIAGAIAATLSESGIVGYVAGDEDPTINAALNGYIAGAKSVNPDAAVESAVAGSWEDPAKGKEIASAMATRGVDVITTAAAKTQLGVLEGAKEAGVLFIGDVADNSDRAPENAVTYVGSSFGQNIYLGCKYFAENSFPGGEHSFIDLTNDGYFIDTDAIAAWGEASGRADEAAAAIELSDSIEEQVISGALEIEHNTEWPD